MDDRTNALPGSVWSTASQRVRPSLCSEGFGDPSRGPRAEIERLTRLCTSSRVWGTGAPLVMELHSLVMSDETYSLVAIVSSLALMAVLWLRFRQGRILRRLMRSLTDEQLRAAGLDVPQIRARFGPYVGKP